MVLRGRDNPPTLDPAYASRTFDGHLTCLIHGGLVRTDPEGNILPELADSWQVRKDGREYLFRLPSDLRFPSGRPFGATDVVYSWSRVCRPETASPVAWVFEDIEGFDRVIDGESDTLSGLRVRSATELSVFLEEPSAVFLAKLTMPAARVVDRSEIERQGKTYGRNPVGLGAWILKEWEDDSHLLFGPNPSYPGRNRKIRGLRFDLVTRDFSAGARFESGALHILNPLPTTQSDYWRRFPEWESQIRVSPQFNLYYLGFSCHRPPFRERGVRKAVAKAIRVDRIRETLYGDRAISAGGPVPPGLLGFTEKPHGPSKLTERELEILKNLSFQIAYPDVDPMAALVMEAVQAELRRYGTRCRLQRLDRTAYTSWRREGKFDAFLGNWWADYPDPDNFVTPLFTTDSGSNMTRFSDPLIDELAGKARKTIDPESRERLYRRIAHRLREECPMLFLWHLHEEVLIQPWVEGYTPPRLFQGTLYLRLGVGNRSGK